MARLELGVDICFGKKRWPEPEAWLELVTKRLGLQTVEFDSDFLDPFFVSEPGRSQIASETRKLALQYGVSIHNYYTGTMTHCVNLMSSPDARVRRDGVRWCEEAIRLATKLGARGIGGHFDTFSARTLADTRAYDDGIDRLVSNFQELSQLAKQEGQEFILLEQMYTPSEVPYTMAQAERLLERMNRKAAAPILLTLDLGHACCQNFCSEPADRDPYEWIRRFAPVSPVIHLQQTDGLSSCHWPFTAQYNRRGIVDGRKVLDAISSTSADEVFLVLEIFFSLSDSDEKVMREMEESVVYWKRCLERG